MRPTVPELLAGLERLLTDEVAPYVSSPHAGEVLANVAASLVRLQRLWVELDDHLDWDNQAMERLLDQAEGPVLAHDPALGDRLRELAADRAAPGVALPSDTRAVHNAALRDALAAVIRCLAGPASPALIEEISGHLRAALRRAP